MTEEEKKAIEEAEKVATQKKIDDDAAKADEEGVAEALVKTYADLEKARIERDNYREGLLKAKGKKPEDETEDEKINRIVDEKIASSQVGKLVQDFQNQLAKVVKENKELKVANRAKTSMDSKAGGGNQDHGADGNADPLAAIPAELRRRIANISPERQKKLIEKWRAAQIIK